jgi:hypothetical protein
MWPPAQGIILRGGSYPRRWGLVEHWKLDEASGIAIPSYGTNTLTDNNTVTSAAGKVYATARQFVQANSESLSIADNAALSTGNVDFWFALWINPDDVNTGFHSWVAKDDNVNIDYNLFSNNTQINLGVTTAGGQKTATINAALSAATWAFLLGYHDAANDLVGISVNGGAFTTAATGGSAPNDTSAIFTIGCKGNSTLFCGGRIGPVAFGKSPPAGIAALATEIRDRMYAGGVGRPYPWR